MSNSNRTASGSTAPASPPRVANIVSVSSGKGGVGKTLFAVSLGHALARDHAKVLLFDGDLGLANVDIKLGLMPSVDLSTVISGQRSLRSAITAYPEGGFDIVAGQSGSGALAAISPRRLTELCEELISVARDYDMVVVDLGAGITHAVQAMMRIAGINLVVTTEEPTALTDAYALIKVMARANAATAVRVVVNMAAHERGGRHTYNALLKACEEFLGLAPPLAGIVRKDIRVPEAIRHQVPLLTRHPNSDAASDITAIAGSIGEGA